MQTQPSSERGGSRLPPDLGFYLEVITPDEETKLIRLIENSGLTYSAYDPDNRRSSCAFGWDYSFADDSFIPCEPMPEGFRSICANAAARAGVGPESFAECLLNRYEEGAVIQPHFDKPVWDIVVGVSLGAKAVMKFRKSTSATSDCIDVILPRRSLYVLRGASRYEYTHEIPPVGETRWSITFRSMSEEGIHKLESAAAAS